MNWEATVGPIWRLNSGISFQRLRKIIKDMPGHPVAQQTFQLGTRSKRLQRFHYTDCSDIYQQKLHPRTCKSQSVPNILQTLKQKRSVSDTRSISCLRWSTSCAVSDRGMIANCELHRIGRGLVWHVTKFTCRGWANQENPQSAQPVSGPTAGMVTTQRRRFMTTVSSEPVKRMSQFGNPLQ
jgi:hypothetical protein